jgi:hypothetical protein
LFSNDSSYVRTTEDREYVRTSHRLSEQESATWRFDNEYPSRVGSNSHLLSEIQHVKYLIKIKSECQRQSLIS